MNALRGFPTQGAVRGIELVGLALIGVAVAWWAIVYVQVLANTGFPVSRTLPCLLYTSDRCSLAMALCKEWHFLGIRRYSAELLWIGAAIGGLALILGTGPWSARGARNKQG